MCLPRICTDVLITSDKRGIDSHGIGRLKPIYYDRIKDGTQSPMTDIEIVKDGPIGFIDKTTWKIDKGEPCISCKSTCAEAGKPCKMEFKCGGYVE